MGVPRPVGRGRGDRPSGQRDGAGPAAEVAEALGEGPYPGLLVEPAAPDGRLPAVTLRAGAPSGTGPGEPDIDDYADLWTTERDAWLLEDTGSGYLITSKGEQPVQLLICHEELHRHCLLYTAPGRSPWR